VVGLDAVEFAFGYENIVNMTNHILQKWDETDDVNVVVMKTGQKSIRMMTHMVDTYFVIRELNGGLCIYGLIPRTEPYYITRDAEKKIHLIPIV